MSSVRVGDEILVLIGGVIRQKAGPRVAIELTELSYHGFTNTPTYFVVNLEERYCDQTRRTILVPQGWEEVGVLANQ